MIVELALLAGCANPLPVDLTADIGIPVAYDDDVIYLYGDTIRAGSLVARNTVVAGNTVISPALADTVNGTWYWPTDAMQTADGLFVVALEMTAGGMLGYEVTDTDVFVVTDPHNAMSWKLAAKIEDGPWGDSQVQFSDQLPLAFVRDPYGVETGVYEMTTPTEWVALGGSAPDSHGVFAPVQTGDGWYGWSWQMWHTATLWRGPGPGGPWTEVETIHTDAETYDHGLNVTNGEACWRYSTVGGVHTEPMEEG